MGTAFDNASMGDFISAQTIERIRSDSLMRNISNDKYQAEFDANPARTAKVRVFRSQYENEGKKKDGTALQGNDIPQTGNYDATTGGEWAEGGNDGLTYENIVADKEIIKSWFTPEIAQLQIGDIATQQAIEVLGEQMTWAYDDRSVNEMLAAVTVPAAQRYGKANDYLDPADATFKGSATALTGKVIFDSIRQYRLHIDKIRKGRDSLNPGIPLMAMNFEPFYALEEWLLEQKYPSAGSLNEDILRGRFNPAGITALARVVSDVGIILSNRIPFTAVTSKNYFNLIGTTTEAFTRVTQSFDTDYFSKAQNQQGDGTAAGKNKRGPFARSAMVYGNKLIDDRTIKVWQVRAEA